MPSDLPSIVVPASYVTEHVVAYGDTDDKAVRVGAASPLPVTLAMTGAGVAPLTGTTAASIVSPAFNPALGRPIWITLSGNWTGSILVKRSVDGGTTKLPLTLGGNASAVFTANAQEPVGEESVAGGAWYLDIALTSGTLTYEVRQ